jgi:hypothetical protein
VVSRLPIHHFFINLFFRKGLRPGFVDKYAFCPNPEPNFKIVMIQAAQRKSETIDKITLDGLALSAD